MTLQRRSHTLLVYAPQPSADSPVTFTFHRRQREWLRARFFSDPSTMFVWRHVVGDRDLGDCHKRNSDEGSAAGSPIICLDGIWLGPSRRLASSAHPRTLSQQRNAIHYYGVKFRYCGPLTSLSSWSAAGRHLKDIYDGLIEWCLPSDGGTAEGGGAAVIRNKLRRRANNNKKLERKRTKEYQLNELMQYARTDHRFLLHVFPQISVCSP